jgi:hypothetical protein
MIFNTKVAKPTIAPKAAMMSKAVSLFITWIFLSLNGSIVAATKGNR